MRTVAIFFYALFSALFLGAQTTSNTSTTLPPACQLAHVMGGDVSILHISDSTYTLKVMVYRDTMQFVLPDNVQIYIYAYNVPAGQYMYNSSVFVPMDSVLLASTAPICSYETQVGYYTMPITLSPGKYQFVYVSCCRNSDCTNANITTAQYNSIFYTEFQVFSNSDNSSPTSLMPPIAYFPLNYDAAFNPLVYDADGDSLVYKLLRPIGTFISANSTSGFSAIPTFTPPASSGQPLTINSVSGEMTWRPATGQDIQAFEVDEYRAGVQIGKAVLDMGFVVETGATDSLYFTPLSTYTTYPSPNYNYVIYTPGQPLDFQIIGGSNDSGFTMNAYGEVFNMSDPATFTTTDTGNTISGTLNWTPPAGFSSGTTVVFRLKGQMFSKDYTLVLLSATPAPPSTAVTKIAQAGDDVVIYPMPALNTINIKTTADKMQDAVIINTFGQKVWNGQINNGSQIDVQAWAKGMYFLQLLDNSNGQHTVKKIIVD